MTRPDLNRLHDWFTPFCAAYSHDADQEARRNYLLKEEHTRKVCQESMTIAAAEGCSDADLILAESVALLHDVGRFPQYREFRTFKDSDSVNHAAWSVRTIVREKILTKLPKDEQRLIIRSIALHNVYTIPEFTNRRDEFFLRLIRDADKLDIWRVFLKYYNLPEDERASAVGLGFPDTPASSPEIITAINEGKMINLRDVRTLNDFKLLQLSWLFDLNFHSTRSLFWERGYLAAFAAILPASEEIRNLLAILESHLDRTMSVGQAAASGEPAWIR